MKKNVVNPYVISVLLRPFSALGEKKEEEIRKIEAGDFSSISNVLKEIVVPYFSKFSDEDKAAVKRSLGYFLENDEDVWDDLLEIHRCPLPETDPSRVVFELLWHELFSGEPWGGYRKSDFVVERHLRSANYVGNV